MNDNKYIEEFENNKNRLFQLVERLEKTLDHMEKLIPQKYDFKTRYIIADRIQILTGLYDTILRYRTEIAKQLEKLSNLSTDSLDPESTKQAIIYSNVEDLKKLLKS